MNRPLSNTMDVTPLPTRQWAVLIQVLQNGHVQYSKTGAAFKRLLFTDGQGTKSPALIFSAYLRYFANLLSPYKRYYISNAIVSKNEPKYRVSSYPYSWILTNRTLVEELIEPVPPALPCDFHFTNFQDLHRYAESDNLQNVKAIVLECFPSKPQGSEATTRRDIVIVNEEKKLMLLTLWNDFDDNDGRTLANIAGTAPMIFGMKLKVTTFNYLSLTTRGVSAIMINPPVTENLQTRQWYNQNCNQLQQLLQEKTYKDRNLLLPYPKQEEIVTVSAAVATLNTVNTAWVKGKMTLPTQQTKFWYTACANCQKPLDADITWIVTCPSCKEESEVYTMCRFPISINDGTASIIATISTPNAEMFIPLNALQLKTADENGVDMSETISMAIQQQTIVAFLRSYELTFRGQNEMRIKIVNAYSSLPSTETLATSSASPPATGNTKDVTTISAPIKAQSSASQSASIKKQNTAEGSKRKA